MTCFLCLHELHDGRDPDGIITVGIGFDVHKDCYDRWRADD